MTAPAEKHGQITNSPQQYRPYPVYKDVGVEWLREIPAHWEVRRIRNVVDMRVSNVDKHTKEGELPVRLCNYVDVYKNDRITEHLSFMRATATEKEVERFRLEPGDVLITKDSESWNQIGIPALVEYTADDLICGYHLALLRPQKTSLDGGYLHYALQSPAVAYQFHVAATGVIRYGLSLNAIKSVRLPIPPLPEQEAIVRYLDYVERRIRRYINAKQKLVGLLEELKQATIYEAVTRGLDPDVPLKPSGVEWLGEIPAHWAVRRLKLSVTNSTEQTNKRHEHEIYLALEHVESWTGRYSDAGPDVVFDSQVKRFRAGDILFGKLRPYLAKVARPDRDGVCVGEFLVLRPCGCAMSPEYLKWLLRTKPVIDAINASTYGVKMPRTNWRFIGSMKQPLPPLPEQEAIAEYLDKETTNIDTALNNTRREIELLQEYRTVLIADVVSGKVDVRDIAANLPDEADDRIKGEIDASDMSLGEAMT